mgnify:CR=1 FL=1
MGNKRKGIAELINEVKEYIPDALINDELAILIIDFLLKDFKIYNLRNMACNNHNLHTILLFPNVFIFSVLESNYSNLLVSIKIVLKQCKHIIILLLSRIYHMYQANTKDLKLLD